MITHCQECDTYFRVSIEQLKASQGNVKCGCCMTVFNAIESLLEHSDPPAHQVAAARKGLAGNKISGSVGSALLGPEAIEEPLIIDEDLDIASLTDINNDPDNDPDNDDTDSSNIVELADTDFTLEDESESILEEGLEFDEDDLSLFEEPIQDDFQVELEEPHKQSRGIWFFASLLMLAMLTFQFFKFNPETILAKFPQLQVLCRVIDCPVEKEFNDTSKINLLSRDVREHPQFKDVLLVNATLMNSASDYQPFPKLQLDLFDKVGRPIGSRQFSPDEYLDSSVDLSAGMKPELPVHIVLEVIGTDEETSSFEFKFL